jgi:hypothetical protein
MEKCPGEIDSRSDTQEIPRVSGNTKINTVATVEKN